MKKSVLAVCILCFCFVCAIVTAPAAEIKAQDVSGKPKSFLKVEKAPDPLLLGHWGCVNPVTDLKTGQKYQEPVEYWLVKSGDQYGLYFYRVKGSTGKKYSGWQKWTAKGDKITSMDVEISIKEGAVHYQWKNDKPTKMTRIDENQ